MDDGTTLWRVGVIAASRLVHLVSRCCRSGQWYFNIDRRAAATKKLAATNWSSWRLLHQTRPSNIRWKWRSHPSAWIAASFHGELQSRGAHQGAQGFRVPSSPWPWMAWRNVYAHCPGPSPWSVDRDGRLDLSVLCKHVHTRALVNLRLETGFSMTVSNR